ASCPLPLVVIEWIEIIRIVRAISMVHKASTPTMSNWQHVLRAQLRDLRVLFRESRGSLLALLAVVVLGTLAFRFLYPSAQAAQHPGLGQALFGTFSLIFFNPSLDYPQAWYMQALYFIIPLLGLASIVEGFVRFSAAVVNKKDRGQKWQVAMASTYRDHVIVCGVGKVGYRVIQELRKFGREIVAIESDPNGRFVEKVKSQGIPLIQADARRSTHLLQAGVDKADAIVPCTNDELTNLDIALDAREMNPEIKVVMRMFDPDLARRIEKGFGIHTAFSTSALAAPIFATAAMRVKVKTSFYVGDVLLNLSEVVVNPGARIVGWTIAEVEAHLDLSIVCYRDQDCTDLHPPPELRLKAGSTLLVLAPLETLQRLEELNRSAEG
ncbi:MAG: NAD-binding protein, partial [Chloroflexia bacterium]|nr:NAD-binding protein [Chloroflexia bacterium]